MKSLLLAAFFTAAGLAAQRDIYVSIAAQIDGLARLAVVPDSIAGGPATIREAAAHYRSLARHYQQLGAALMELDRTLLELRMDTPVSPMAARMRQLRKELAVRLRSTNERANLPETARLLRLIHLADIEIAEAATREDEDSQDPRLPRIVAALRRLEGQIWQNQCLAAAEAEALANWAR